MKVETKVTVLGWLLVTCAAAASVLGGAEEGDRATPQPVPSVADVEREIAVVRLGEFRLTVTAARESDEDAMPTATVHLTADEQVDGAWVPIDREQVGEPRGWFWYPLSGRGAVCQLSTGDTAVRPVELSLLLSPSLGCSPTFRFELHDGELVAV